MPLKEYHQKRDFKKTREPHTKTQKKKNKRPTKDQLMFVVQEHHASHLHYDFRLEWRGVLKSWAVPKGPSLDPHLKRLAVQVEDHPLDYGSFEGVIPEDQYGAGEVYIWDTGIWIPKGTPTAGFKKGHLEFELKGTRLKGTWDLIRTRMQGRQVQWLLVKREDRYAKAGDEAPVIGASEKPATRHHWGRKESTFDFVSPMLALLTEKPPLGKEWLHELKFDGYRIQAHVRNSQVQLLTRAGHDWSGKMPSLLPSLRRLNVQSAVLDGEVVVLDDKGVSHFQKLQNHFRQSADQKLVYQVFDLLMLNGRDLRELPLRQRRRKLSEILRGTRGDLKISAEIKSPTAAILRKLEAQGQEGIVSKRRDSAYVSGRKGQWLKSKFQSRQEFVIGGYTQGQGGREQFGALMLGVQEKEGLRYVGKVGTGFDQGLIETLLKKLHSRKRKTNPFKNGKPPTKGTVWVKPSLVAEVRFANWTQDQHLRAPVFVGLRHDKPAVEVSAESLLLTHPDKVLFSGDGVTKLQVAQYYIAVADRMWPYLENRLLALLRCPEGSAGKCFFQKHLNSQSDSTAILEKADALYVQELRGLLELVQMGAYEIHGRNSRAQDPKRPEQFVLDLDPGPGVTWSEVVSAALLFKKDLNSLGLKSFVKLSGGKGVHIHVPFKSGPSWQEVKSFTQSLAQLWETRYPEKFVSKMSKKLRAGKIFIDYLRNTEGSTSVLPYSLRAREFSSVAMPVAWTELKKFKGGDAVSLEKALQMVKKNRDPWANYFTRAPVLPIKKTRSAS